MSVKDVQTELGLSKNSTYKLVNLTGFPKVKIGKKILIPRDEFEKFIKQHIGSQIILD
jgi:excisionase family DNA binding protein